ncbi:MAG: HAMP domain-containing sensor histidine kinase [Gallionella sp.]
MNEEVTRRDSNLAAENYWRPLLFFNLFRLSLSSFFLLLSVVFGSSLSLDAANLRIFTVTSALYFVLVIASLLLLRARWPRFNLQLAGQICGDIVALTVLSYASGGIQSNLGLLLLISLGAAGIISRGLVTLFFASLASIAALLEHGYAVMSGDAEVAQYVQVGLLCISYFAVAWLAHTLAKFAVESQSLAQRRGRDLVSLAEANRLVMRDLKDGVVVLDGQGNIMQMNHGAEVLLRKIVSHKNHLSEIFPMLYREYTVWKDTGNASRDILRLDEGLQARLRFVTIERNASNGAVIFLEDMRRVRAAAQQIKLAALGRLTANIAHEVRNPLSAISYAAELLQEEVLDDKQQRLLQIVRVNTLRINQIVNDVMQLNRRDRAVPEEFDLSTMLRVFMEEFCLAERFDRELLVLVEKSGVEVTFDRGHLRQILWNLCGNAFRFCRKLPGSVILTTNVANQRVVMDIQDDGPGIPMEHQGQLFEPFFTTAPDGTGLGLYIARELCEANASTLEYHAEDSMKGACFRITFGEPRWRLT